MDIDKILQDLGIDLSNPEAKRGAIDAIDAILSSRIPPIVGMGGGAGEVDVEIDPDLVQPSPKHDQPDSQDDIEIEDEEDILSQVKTNKPENKPGQDKNSENDSDSSEDSGEESEDTDNTETCSGKKSDDDDKDWDEASEENDEEANEAGEEPDDFDDSADSNIDGDSSGDGDYADSDEEGDYFDSDEEDESEDEDDIEAPGADGGDNDENDESDDEETDADEEDEDYLDDEEPILDDKLRGIRDKDIEAKSRARKIKRERTLAAAKKTLEKAKTTNTSKSLINELEKAIAELESLTEAAKHIDDLSDDEFNAIVNRVFDAIDAIGGSGLTYSSAAEREQKVKEIKADLSSTNTQHELSAEDAEIIRAETQAIRAREKDAEKYKTKARGSFKGFQDFLNSLRRAIALQVQTNRVKDSSWSALSRRNSGVGVLQQGKRIKELPDRKIPIIDFYFDYSLSWDAHDLAIGKKAAEALTKMEEDGEIKVNRYYFGDHVANTPDRTLTGSGTRGWNEIVKNVIATGATNVIIMTDDDMENWWSPQHQPPLAYTVQGYVWYLWKNGSNAPRLPRDLKGRGGVQQFSFSASDVN